MTKNRLKQKQISFFLYLNSFYHSAFRESTKVYVVQIFVLSYLILMAWSLYLLRLTKEPKH